MSNWTAEGALYHHGILGMKWGVRRFQNKDGSLTPAGEERYGVDSSGGPSGEKAPKEKKKSKSRQKYEEFLVKTYMKKGVSRKDAEVAAEKRVDLTKKVLIGTGVAVGAAATIAAARHIGRNWFDETLKEGSFMQNVSVDSDIVNRGQAFYASYRNMDNMKYRGLFGTDQFTEKAKQLNKIAVEKNVKIASTRNAKKIYDNLRENDIEFRDVLKELDKSMFRSSGNKPGADYKTFNTNDLMYSNPAAEKVKEKYFDALKKAGYSGLHDLNDRAYSGFNTKANIMFDKSALKQVSSVTMDKDKLSKDSVKALMALLGDSMIKPENVARGAIAVSAIKVGKFDKKVINQSKKGRKKSNGNQNSKSNKR